MKKLTQKFVSVVATSTMLLSIVSPVAADTVTVSGNGSGSDNTVNTNSVNTTAVAQTNVANVTNSVTVRSTTGDNTASRNTGGDVRVDTGNAGSQVNIANTLNNNSATLDCCLTNGLSIDISGNGAGSAGNSYPSVYTTTLPEYGSNTVNANQTNDTTVVQDNVANVANAVDAVAKTGGNDADANTGGEVRILTGDADSLVGISTTANNNSLRISGPSGATGATGLVSGRIIGNGADSDNLINLNLEKSLTVSQDNEANVANDVYAKAKTGGNSAWANTGGDVRIDTGDASTIVGIENNLNFNHAEIDCCSAFTLDALIKGNGADSDNYINANMVNTKYVLQDNSAAVANAVDGSASTGHNYADSNTGENVRIFTGHADSLIGIDNLVNFNHADIDCCLTSFSGAITGNGADSVSDINANRVNDQLALQTNGAGLSNYAGGEYGGSHTGYNDASGNTGSVLGISDPSIYTGNAAGVTTIGNAVNTNDVSNGTTLHVPGFNMNLELVWSTNYWNQFWNQFFWM